MKNQIWKFEISDSQKSFLIPIESKILHIQVEDGIPCIWVRVDPTTEKTKRHFELFDASYNTEYDGVERAFIGAFQMDGVDELKLFERL